MKNYVGGKGVVDDTACFFLLKMCVYICTGSLYSIDILFQM